MRVTVKLFLIVFIVCFLFSFTDACGQVENNWGVCIEKKCNYTGPALFTKIKEIVPRIWTLGVPLTELGQKYKRVILHLTKKGSLDDILVSAGATIYFTQYVPFLNQEPDACIFAAFVNGTVSCAVDHDKSQLLNALTQLKTSFAQVRNNLALEMIYRAGCDCRCGQSPPDPVHNKTVCYKNGFVYPVEALLNLPGSPYANISPKLKKVVLELYNSDNYLDNFLAACTSFTVTESFQKAFSMWECNIILEAMEMALCQPVEKKCCFTRIKAAFKNSEDNIAKAGKVIDTLTNYYKTSGCQKNK